jgi:tetratricopeptide (TPR) repeat protein
MLAPATFWGPTPLAVGLPRIAAFLEDASNSKTDEAWLLRPVAGFYGMQGRFDEGRALLARSRSIHEELSSPLEASVLAFWSGPLEILAGNPAAAERDLRSAREYLESRGEQGWLSTIAAFHGLALYAEGRFDDAADAARLSRETATSDDSNAQAMWRCVEAQVLARREQFGEAEAIGREAVAVIDRTDELNNQAEVRLGLVEVLKLSGQPEKAIAILDEAIARYEQKGNAVRLEQSRALRDELSAA